MHAMPVARQKVCRQVLSPHWAEQQSELLVHAEVRPRQSLTHVSRTHL